MEREIRKLKVECDAELISSSHWRTGFPPSLRIRNVVAIAKALQRRAYLDVEDPTALIGAISAELAHFKISSGDYEYLMRVSHCLQRIRHAVKDLQDPCMMPPLLGSNSREDIAIPSWYFMAEPITNKYMVARYLKKPASNSSQNVSVPHGPFPQNIIKRRRKQPAAPYGPFKSLLRRHNEITGSLKKLLSLFLWKFNRTRKLHCLSVQASCDRLTNDLKKLAKMLETLEIQSAVMDLKAYPRSKTVTISRQSILQHPRMLVLALYKWLWLLSQHTPMTLLKSTIKRFIMILVDTTVCQTILDIPEARQQDQPDLLSDIHPPEQPQHSGLDDQLFTFLTKMECMLKLFNSNGDQQAQGGEQMAGKRTSTRRKRR